MPRDSLSNDTRDADEHNKPQSKTVTGGTVTDCGFRVSSMIQYATLPHRDYGAVSTFDQQQGTGVDRGDGIVADGGEPASRVEQQRQNCALAGCLEPPTKTLHIKRGDVDWYDRYCDEHAKLQLETENAEVCR